AGGEPTIRPAGRAPREKPVRIPFLRMFQAFLQAAERYQIYGWIALAVAAFSTPLAAQLARRLGVMDMPDTFLKPHARPTPSLGGLAICLGWAVSVALSIATNTASAGTMLPILLGGVGMSVLGLLDDARDISPKVRLAIGAAIIASVLVSTQIGFRLIDSIL